MTLRDRAGSIVRTLANRFVDPETTVAAWQTTAATTLATGCPGMALLYAELAHDDARYQAAAHAWLREATQRHNTVGSYSGVLSLSFATSCAARGPGDYPAARRRLGQDVIALADALTRQDEQRRAEGGRCVTSAACDALTELGAIALMQGRDELVARILDALVAMTEPIEVDGQHLVGWWLAQSTLDHSPTTPANGHANLGMAHGASRPLALLALARQHGVQVAGQDRAITALADWLLQHRRKDADRTPWPATLTASGDEGTSCRPSWCYGAAGIVRALYLAGVALDVARWRDCAVVALRSTMSNLRATPRLVDPGLCHGWAGLLQVTCRMAMDSHDADLSAGQHGIAAELLALVDEATHSGFRFAPRPGHHASDRFGFLTGAAGAALALHTYSTGSAPVSHWDRALLLA